MIKWHKKFNHHTPGVVYFGERGEIPLRINTSQNKEEVIMQEALHYHRESTQFFLVIEGLIAVEVEGKILEIAPDQVLEVQPETVYRVLKVSENSKWVVIGTVNKDGDRVEVAK